MKYVFGGSFICKVRGLSDGLLPNHGSSKSWGVHVLHVTRRGLPLAEAQRCPTHAGQPLLCAYCTQPPCPAPTPQQDAGTAKKLAFAREVSTRCITHDGDDFNPGGTLTGGSRNKGNSVLVRDREGAAALLKRMEGRDGRRVHRWSVGGIARAAHRLLMVR